MRRRWAAWAFAGILLVSAALRVIFHEDVGAAMDETFVLLVLTAGIALLVPWERVENFKAGGLEVALAPVDRALGDMPPTVDIGDLRETIVRLQPLLQTVRRSRVLWIEDHPATVRAERRLFRALGLEIIPALTSEGALARLREDNDIDLVISDVKRGKEPALKEGSDDPAGVQFFLHRIRNDDRDAFVRDVPFIFYSALAKEEARTLTASARRADPPPQLATDVRDLVDMVVAALWARRSRPPEGPSSKRDVYASKWRGRGDR